MNRAQRRRLNSKRKGATQLHHRSVAKKNDSRDGGSKL